MEEKISMRESIETGAPNIKYNRGDIRMGMEEDTQGIWSQMEPQQKAQFASFDAFFQSGIWKQIIQQLQQDQSGIRSQAPEMSMSENVNMAEQMPGGGIADVDVREKVAMAANGGLMGLYNRGM